MSSHFLSHSWRIPQTFLFQRTCHSEHLCFSLFKAPPVILFFMEKLDQFMTLCPCLGDLCHPMDFKVQEQTSSFRAVPPIFSYNQEMGNFLHCLNHPSEALPQGFLCKLFLKHKDGIRVLSMACWHWGLGPFSDLYHTLVEPVVMTIFFIYTTPCFGGLGWVEEGWEPDERLHENSLHFPCSPGKEI